jgi:hypothetical protein
MGATQAHQLNDVTEEKINKFIVEFLKKFTLEFNKVKLLTCISIFSRYVFSQAYTVILVNKAVEEIEPTISLDSDARLQTPPLQTDPLKCGMLTKVDLDFIFSTCRLTSFIREEKFIIVGNHATLLFEMKLRIIELIISPVKKKKRKI